MPPLIPCVDISTLAQIADDLRTTETSADTCRLVTSLLDRTRISCSFQSILPARPPASEAQFHIANFVVPHSARFERSKIWRLQRGGIL